MANGPPSAWPAREVSAWLRTLELSQYAPRFEALGIDGALLFEITDDDLARDLGVAIRLHRVKLLEGIRRLRQGDNPPSQSTEPDLSMNDSDSPAHFRAVGLRQVPQVSESHCDLLMLKALDGALLAQCTVVGPGGAIFGRQSTASDIVIPESSVSRKHCQIQYAAKSNQFLLQDLGSTTGTFLLLRKPIPLRLGQLFQAGSSEFLVYNVLYSPWGAVLALELLLYEGPSHQLVVSVPSQGLTIGRDQSNGFCVEDDPQMSAFHLRIFQEDYRFWLADEQSTNGVWLRLSPEGEHSDFQAIVQGDVLKLGASVFAVQQAKSALTAMCACELRPRVAVLLPCGHLTCEECSHETCLECGSQVQTRVPLVN